MSDPNSSAPEQFDALFAQPDVAQIPTVSPVQLGLIPGAAAVPLGQSEFIEPPREDVIRHDQRLRNDAFFPWVTSTCVLLNVGIFLLMISRGVSYWEPSIPDLLAWGANYAPYTWNGQLWRLVTSMFIHCGILHLAFNMWALWSAGRILERLVGNVGFAIIYFASGVAGSWASLWWNGDIVSAGASGAIFGVLGAFASFIWNRSDSIPMPALRQLRSSLAMCIGYNVLFGFTIPAIDMAAHTGSLIFGLILGLMLTQRLDRHAFERRFRKNLIAGAVSASVLGVLIAGHPAAPPDLFRELEKYEQTVLPTINKFVTKVREFNDKTVSSDQLVDYIQQEILPPWQELVQQFDGLRNIPKGRRELLHQVRTQLKLREESWLLLIEALREDDTIKFSEYKAKWAQADKILRQHFDMR